MGIAMVSHMKLHPQAEDKTWGKATSKEREAHCDTV